MCDKCKKKKKHHHHKEHSEKEVCVKEKCNGRREVEEYREYVIRDRLPLKVSKIRPQHGVKEAKLERHVGWHHYEGSNWKDV